MDSVLKDDKHSSVSKQNHWMKWSVWHKEMQKHAPAASSHSYKCDTYRIHIAYAHGSCADVASGARPATGGCLGSAAARWWELALTQRK